jgi:hypothetical protein
MVTATLVVAAISITSLYFGLLELVDSGEIEKIRISEIHAPFVHASGIALATTLLIVMIASIIYFRITLPLAQKIEQQA